MSWRDRACIVCGKGFSVGSGYWTGAGRWVCKPCVQKAVSGEVKNG